MIGYYAVLGEFGPDNDGKTTKTAGFFCLLDIFVEIAGFFCTFFRRSFVCR